MGSSSSSEEEEKKTAVQPQEEEAPKILSEAEMNTLASKAMKAEILGNDEAAGKLRQQLEEARKARADLIASGGDPEKRETEVRLKVTGMEKLEKGRKTETMRSTVCNSCTRGRRWVKLKTSMDFCHDWLAVRRRRTRSTIWTT